MKRHRSVQRTATKSIKVLLADDMELLRTALVSVLSGEDDMEVVADVNCDHEVVSVALRSRPDIAVVAANAPGDHGVRAVSELARQLPTCRIVALTGPGSIGAIKRLLAAGVSGLMDKNAPATRLVEVIRELVGGATVIDPHLAVAVLGANRNPFTPREQDVLKLAAGGATGPEIARTLSLAQGTVRNYLSNVINKTGARTRIDAIRIATEAGWL